LGKKVNSFPSKWEGIIGPNSYFGEGIQGEIIGGGIPKIIIRGFTELGTLPLVLELLTRFLEAFPKKEGGFLRD